MNCITFNECWVHPQIISPYKMASGIAMTNYSREEILIKRNKNKKASSVVTKRLKRWWKPSQKSLAPPLVKGKNRISVDFFALGKILAIYYLNFERTFFCRQFDQKHKFSTLNQRISSSKYWRTLQKNLSVFEPKIPLKVIHISFQRHNPGKAIQ